MSQKIQIHLSGILLITILAVSCSQQKSSSFSGSRGVSSSAVQDQLENTEISEESLSALLDMPLDDLWTKLIDNAESVTIDGYDFDPDTSADLYSEAVIDASSQFGTLRELFEANEIDIESQTDDALDISGTAELLHDLYYGPESWETFRMAGISADFLSSSDAIDGYSLNNFYLANDAKTYEYSACDKAREAAEKFNANKKYSLDATIAPCAKVLDGRGQSEQVVGTAHTQSTGKDGASDLVFVFAEEKVPGVSFCSSALAGSISGVISSMNIGAQCAGPVASALR